jgi:flavin-dependent dehydrogenase
MSSSSYDVVIVRTGISGCAFAYALPSLLRSKPGTQAQAPVRCSLSAEVQAQPISALVSLEDIREPCHGS